MLSLDTARRLGLPLGGKVRVSAVSKTLTGHWPVKIRAKLGSLVLPQDYLALNLRDRLSDACNRPVDGLVGADFFRGRVVEIDYDAQKLRFLDALPPKDTGDCIPL